MSHEREKYLLETVLPTAAELGRFGAGVKFLRSDKDEGETGAQYASSIAFVNALVSDNSSDTVGRNIKLVVKFPPENEKIQQIMNSKVQFHNEDVMYSDILPQIEFNNIVNELFPKCYYSDVSNKNGKEAVIVLEDLRESGFSISKLSLYLDYNHVILTLKALGKFHALSYIAKQKNPEMFNKLKDKLVEHAWNREESEITLSVKNVIGPCALRGVNALNSIKNNEKYEKLIKKLQEDSVGLMKYFIKPEEPTAVICHGDFCNHNILFKYDANSPDIPTDVRFFDLQTSRYASPVIDLSMILFLNTDSELRSQYWNEFISTYYNSVKDTVTAANCIPPSFEQLTDEFKNKSFYGYFHCSYFLPMMLSEVRPNLEESTNSDPEELLAMLLQVGGDKGTQGIASIVKHIVEHDYLSFLKE